MAFLYQQNNEGATENFKERHHSVGPSYSCNRNPFLNIERDTQSKTHLIQIDCNACLGEILYKPLVNIISYNKRDTQTSKCHKDLSKCEDCSVKMVLESSTPESQIHEINDR
jgi:hypothetical protein